jgi:hypothetical protein
MQWHGNDVICQITFIDVSNNFFAKAFVKAIMFSLLYSLHQFVQGKGIATVVVRLNSVGCVKQCPLTSPVVVCKVQAGQCGALIGLG